MDSKPKVEPKPWATRGPHLNGYRVTTGTGMGLDANMYTLALLKEHLGEAMYFVFKQTNSPVSALVSYMDLREIWGDEAQIVIIRPGELTV